MIRSVSLHYLLVLIDCVLVSQFIIQIYFPFSFLPYGCSETVYIFIKIVTLLDDNFTLLNVLMLKICINLVL